MTTSNAAPLNVSGARHGQRRARVSSARGASQLRHDPAEQRGARPLTWGACQLALRQLRLAIVPVSGTLTDSAAGLPCAALRMDSVSSEPLPEAPAHQRPPSGPARPLHRASGLSPLYRATRWCVLADRIRSPRFRRVQVRTRSRSRNSRPRRGPRRPLDLRADRLLDSHALQVVGNTNSSVLARASGRFLFTAVLLLILDGSPPTLPSKADEAGVTAVKFYSFGTTSQEAANLALRLKKWRRRTD
jgi:hypothetical protein